MPQVPKQTLFELRTYPLEAVDATNAPHDTHGHGFSADEVDLEREVANQELELPRRAPALSRPPALPVRIHTSTMTMLRPNGKVL